ncbi:uncharacterized protein LOC135390072 [Ornithodoros turicata]|uniref:uncharacterized protein LOC135390072 n=1 Tax=Ornithodoros turicata TaxID=34597 RepID=UPI0031396219
MSKDFGDPRSVSKAPSSPDSSPGSSPGSSPEKDVAPVPHDHNKPGVASPVRRKKKKSTKVRRRQSSSPSPLNKAAQESPDKENRKPEPSKEAEQALSKTGVKNLAQEANTPGPRQEDYPRVSNFSSGPHTDAMSPIPTGHVQEVASLSEVSTRMPQSLSAPGSLSDAAAVPAVFTPGSIASVPAVSDDCVARNIPARVSFHATATSMTVPEVPPPPPDSLAPSKPRTRAPSVLEKLRSFLGSETKLSSRRESKYRRPGIERKATSRTRHARVRQEVLDQGQPYYLMSGVLVLLVVILATGIIVVIVTGPLSAEKLAVACTTPECKRMKEDVDALVNHDIHPCDDMYSYVCGKWKNGGSFVSDVIGRYNSTMIDALSSHSIKEPDQYGMHVFSTLFGSCQYYMQKVNRTITGALQEAIMLLNLTDILRAQSQSDIFSFMFDIQLETGIYALFRVEFLRKGDGCMLEIFPGLSIIGKLYGAYSDLEADGYPPQLSALKEKIITIVCYHFKFPNDTKALVDAIVSLDDQIHAELLRPTTVTTTTFGNFTDLFPIVNHEIIRSIVDDVLSDNFKLHPNDSVRVTGADRIKKVHDILNDETLQVAKVYYLVNLLAGLLRYDLLRKYARKNKWLYSFACMKSVSSVLMHTLPYLLASLPGQHQGSVAAMELVDAIKDKLLSDNLLSALDEDTVRESQRIVQEIAVSTYNVEDLGHLHHEIDHRRWRLQGNFLAILVQAKRLKMKMLYKVLYENYTTALTESQLSHKLTYYSSTKLLTVPTAYQGSPLLFADKLKIPFYFNFATLGALIAREIVRAFAAPSGKVTVQLESYFECLKRIAAIQGLNVSDAIDRDPWNSALVVWSYGARLVYHIMYEALSSYGQSMFQQQWNTAQYYFFVRFCMLSCVSTNRPTCPRSFKEQCIVPLFSNGDFASHFDCTSRPNFRTDACVASF